MDSDVQMHESECCRRRDFLYRVLVPLYGDGSELDMCVNGVKDMMNDHKACHPSLRKLLESSNDIYTKKALVLFGLHTLPPFLRFVIERDDACSSAVSLFTHCFLVDHVQRFLDGECGPEDFVDNAVADYICT